MISTRQDRLLEVVSMMNKGGYEVASIAYADTSRLWGDGRVVEVKLVLPEDDATSD